MTAVSEHGMDCSEGERDMNGHAHFVGGVIAGPVTGLLLTQANRQPTLPEIGGWFFGLITGAKAPDLLEPAYCPRHRELCHSFSVLLLDLAFLQSESLQNLIQFLTAKVQILDGSHKLPMV